MGKISSIEWLNGGHSASPWHGCAEVHEGCDRCYARTMAKRNPGTLGVWGKGGTRVRSASFWDNCRRWNKAAEKAGVVQSVFPSICDPFESWDGPILAPDGERWHYYEPRRGWLKFPAYMNEQPGARFATMDDLRRDLFSVIDACPWLRFYLLTKRPQNILKMWGVPEVTPEASAFLGFMQSQFGKAVVYRPNVYLLTSVSNQETANAMIPPLLECSDLVPVLGISAEPLLGPVNLERWIGPSSRIGKIGWAIVGGESGNGARDCDVSWIRSLVQQCKTANVPVFVKQLGSNPTEIIKNSFFDAIGTENHPPRKAHHEQRRMNLKHDKGGDLSEWPEDLRVRQYPTEKAVPA